MDEWYENIKEKNNQMCLILIISTHTVSYYFISCYNQTPNIYT